MARLAIALIAGILFGLGLTISHMVDPAKVLVSLKQPCLLLHGAASGIRPFPCLAGSFQQASEQGALLAQIRPGGRVWRSQGPRRGRPLGRG